MVPELRRHYNELFTDEKYKAFLHDLENVYPTQLDFRVAETPVFVPYEFTNQMLSACDNIVDIINTDAYKKESEKAIPPHLRVPNEDKHPHCIAFDFGVCEDGNGGLTPQLIEMQGFPSLFAWEIIIPEIHRKHLWAPENYSDYVNGFDKNSYVELLRKIIVADKDPKNVILLEIFPQKQKTRVDFHATETFLGIKTVCLTELIREGKQLFYMREGIKTPVFRIYNRVIFDDLSKQSKEVQEKGKIFQEDLNVTWVPHPNWFYKISKFTLPYIKHPNVPETWFLDKKELPDDLENYVIKPLFSFAGQGVIIDVKKEDVQNISDPENWIIQKKVKYADAIITPGEPAKAEMRIFYLWEPGAPRPVGTNNLARLSKGKMIGVRYNKDKEWVGGSFCLFEKRYLINLQNSKKYQYAKPSLALGN